MTAHDFAGDGDGPGMDLAAMAWPGRVAAWNSTATDFPDACCIHELIEAQVARAPDRVALRFEDETLSYGDLNTRANQLAHYLREQGVRPDSCVGLCAERSLAMIVGVLAILKAGGAYVPLDVSYPAQRLQYMVSNSGLSLLLTHATVEQRAVAMLSGAAGLRMLAIDTPAMAGLLAGYPAHNPARLPGQSPSSLAYVIYTSGSTGLPKGVMIEHRALVNRIDSSCKRFPMDGKDVFLQNTPFSFDVSVSELIWPFTTGASLVLPRPGGHRDVDYLIGLIQQRGVTFLHLTTSIMTALIQEGDWAGCRSLRSLICGGEALGVDVVKMHYASNPATLWNVYGPTETTIDVTAWKCPHDPALTRVAIGKPMQNARIYLLDEQCKLAPPGAIAELYIGGVGLARGYINRPDLTAERFIADPFSPEPGARLYRSGDLARYWTDGNIEFMGRVDSQVKVNGLRIELGEIESHLRQHPEVRAAVVLAREDVPGDKHLVAYVTLGKEAAARVPAPAAMLRTHLLASLPSFMVPSLYVVLPALPQSPSGKVDTKALPIPQPTLRRLAAMTGAGVRKEPAHVRAGKHE